MLFGGVKMLKKKLGIEGIERDWPSDEEELKDFFKVSSTLIIPEGCDHIGEYAFWSYNELKEVIIPKGVESIGYKAFFECRELEKVEILGSVRTIGKSSFERCVKLKKVIISEGVEVIAAYAFWGCKEAIIILKNSRKYLVIGRDAFTNYRDVKEDISSFRKIRKTLEIWWNRLLKKVGRSRD